ncbi:MAG: nitroreductase family protein [Desulfovibrionales bacterium]
MDVFEAIHTRRSVRTFRREPVSEELIREFLAAAMSAPSAGNQQPWHFIVLKDRDLLEKASRVHPYVKMAVDAPAAILVCGELSREKFPGYWVQDCAAATQNLLLAIHGKGLGGVWTGIYPIEERVEAFTSLLSLPGGVLPFALVVFGYFDHDLKRENRFKEDRVHMNGW